MRLPFTGLPAAHRPNEGLPMRRLGISVLQQPTTKPKVLQGKNTILIHGHNVAPSAGGKVVARIRTSHPTWTWQEHEDGKDIPCHIIPGEDFSLAFGATLVRRNNTPATSGDTASRTAKRAHGAEFGGGDGDLCVTLDYDDEGNPIVLCSETIEYPDDP
jgi:hypothetical protein